MLLTEKKLTKTEENFKKDKRKEKLEEKRLALIKHLELTISKYEDHLNIIENKIKDAKQRGSIGDLRKFNTELKSKKVFIKICKAKLKLLKKASGFTETDEEKKQKREEKENKTVIDKIPIADDENFS